jgi:hypothetical protein
MLHRHARTEASILVSFTIARLGNALIILHAFPDFFRSKADSCGYGGVRIDGGHGSQVFVSLVQTNGKPMPGDFPILLHPKALESIRFLTYSMTITTIFR